MRYDVQFNAVTVSVSILFVNNLIIANMLLSLFASLFGLVNLIIKTTYFI